MAWGSEPATAAGTSGRSKGVSPQRDGGVDPEIIFGTGPDGRVYDQGCLTLGESGHDLEVP